MLELNKIHNIDCLEGMRQMDENSVDAVITDPPYALVSGMYQDGKQYSGGFMGKKWDAQLPSIAIWRECLRVLKPGAFAFIMSAPRFDVLTEMGRRIAQAGFRIDFSPIYWTYASGFPKALNIKKKLIKW